MIRDILQPWLEQATTRSIVPKQSRSPHRGNGAKNVPGDELKLLPLAEILHNKNTQQHHQRSVGLAIVEGSAHVNALAISNIQLQSVFDGANQIRICVR